MNRPGTPQDDAAETPPDVHADADDRPVEPLVDAAEQDGDDLPGYGGPPPERSAPPISDVPDEDREVALEDDDRRG